jgi:cysteine synthase A
MGSNGFQTPMVADSAGVLLKCEFLHPGRSHKARVARSLIADAEVGGYADRVPRPVLLERTGGNLGVALAIEARIRGYELTLVTDPDYSAAKQALARRYGATVLDRSVVFPHCKDNGEAIAEILRRDGDRYHYLNQFQNAANPRTHEFETGPEIASQLRNYGAGQDAIVILVSGLGTGATMRGVGDALAQRFVRVIRIGVQPPNCDLKMGSYGSHPFQGIAVGEPAPFFDIAELDKIVPVTEEQARSAGEYLLGRHGFDVGPSSQANFAALRSVRARLRHPEKVFFLTLLFDRGEDYAP